MRFILGDQTLMQTIYKIGGFESAHLDGRCPRILHPKCALRTPHASQYDLTTQRRHPSLYVGEAVRLGCASFSLDMSVFV